MTVLCKFPASSGFVYVLQVLQVHLMCLFCLPVHGSVVSIPYSLRGRAKAPSPSWNQGRGFALKKIPLVFAS